MTCGLTLCPKKWAEQCQERHEYESQRQRAPLMTTVAQVERHFRIAEVAKLLGLSRAGVYNILRGEVLVDFSRPGKKGIKLVPESTLKRLLDRHTKTFR